VQDDATQDAVRAALAAIPQQADGAPAPRADMHFVAAKIKERVAALIPEAIAFSIIAGVDVSLPSTRYARCLSGGADE
jgi:hypothetical protein